MKELLKDAVREIERLRRHNEVLSAKVEVMDLFACVLHTKAATQLQTSTVDVAWQLQQKVAEIEAQEPAT